MTNGNVSTKHRNHVDLTITFCQKDLESGMFQPTPKIRIILVKSGSGIWWISCQQKDFSEIANNFFVADFIAKMGNEITTKLIFEIHFRS
jgi:hypothetical protein